MIGRARAALLLIGLGLGRVGFADEGEKRSSDVRIDGLAQAPAKLLVFVLRGQDVATPLIAFQARAGAAIEPHMHARVISMDETLAAGGAEFQAKLAACRGAPACLAKLIGAVEAQYLLVLTATRLGEIRVLGARFIDLPKLEVLGDAVDEVPSAKDFLDVLPERIQSAVPPQMWDPYGKLSIAVDHPGASITINGQVVGVSPLRTLGFLPPGDYKVEATLEGFLPASGVGRVEKGQEAKVDLVLVEPPHEASSTWWIWAGVGVLAVAGAATTFALLHNSSSAPDPTFCSASSKAACSGP